MAKRKIELFVEIDNDRDFQHLLNDNANKLICAELYSSAFGSCTALDRLFTQMKLNWSDGKIVLIKVLVDEIDVFERFRNQSEPVYIFIIKKKMTKLFRGVDSIRFGEVAKNEIKYYNMEEEGIDLERPLYELDLPSSDEMEWLNNRKTEREEEVASIANRRVTRQMARKHHRAMLMVPHLKAYNFVLYWPHCFHAHPELYERWDINGIIMVGREEIQLTRESAEDIFYAGDAPLNEASLHKLLSGPSLAICFRLLNEEQHFVSLVRKILYEDIPEFDDTKSVGEQAPHVTAFDFYKTFSPTKEEIFIMRQEEKTRRKEDSIRRRARRLSEMQRIAHLAIEDALEARRMDKENRKLMYLKSGNLAALEALKEEPEDEDVGIVVPEELPDASEEENSEEEDEEEYFPPPGLLIPGFYAPPNDISKVNGLALLFPKLVSEHVTTSPEFLPPHVLVMLEVTKRYKTIEALWRYKSYIINMGIFKATSPYNSVHIAFSVKQFDTLCTSLPLDDIKIVYMISIKTDLALLELVDLVPVHVSRDATWGEEECAAMFPVDYGDNYPVFEDFNKKIT